VFIYLHVIIGLILLLLVIVVLVPVLLFAFPFVDAVGSGGQKRGSDVLNMSWELKMFSMFSVPMTQAKEW
jgi:predicted RND superfamily exporter protein